ncbi:dynamin family protein [Mesobacillus subterraneus]|uniref:Dynamin family protein n=1 Tax=Mesobacillus subterraneus TaxID=285983 RepID=A0A3R9DSS5_9BACI|nr:dynamin family protein [Mesobacillus subterraneus]RSD26559.1 Dynamin family protein [Mesobacillus subterraneus]
MSQTVAQQDRILLGKVRSLYNLMLANHDEDTAVKVKELGRKSVEEEFSIAFCGHFSAGKSSMINRLIGDNILPSSPIPTSANLVRIKSGAEYAKVIFKNGGSRLYPAPYDYETVKSYAKDGDQIQAIEISHQGAEFLEEAVIMDTPGIDSTDDAHRIATESALHLSDIVFYMMDYNHVQSELNFLFTKELTDAGKELYLIINQIDKHQDAELSFEQFRKSVEASFADWGVNHKGIFYTSLKNEEYQHNQFRQLRAFITERKSKRKEILPVSVFKSMEKLAEDHLSYLQQNEAEKVSDLESILEKIPEQERKHLASQLEDIRIKKKKIQDERDPEKEFRLGINEILKNAYLMPFQTRELAEAYLQARQPDFKVGLFFSKQKTEQEKTARLNRFYSDLEDKVQSQLNWHIKDFLTKLFRKHQLTQAELQSAANGFKIDFGEELLENAVKPGARLSGDYVLNYTNDVAEALKNIARRMLQLLKEQFLEHVQMNDDEELEHLLDEEEKRQKLVDAWDGLTLIQNHLDNERRKVSEILYGDSKIKYDESDFEIFHSVDDEPEVITNVETVVSSKAEEKGAESVEASDEQPVTDRVHYHEKQEQLIQKLNFTSKQIEGLPGLRKISRELKEKAGRLKEREFTVALFGAFSAGKSSFANALVGERILPVSPNPTTAAINKIKPVTAEHQHGTVIVKIKNAQELLKELERSLGLFGQTTTDFEQAINQINTLKWEDSGYSAVEKTHYSFLQAFLKGYSQFKGQLGEVLSVDLESFRGYVAEEEKSCFVEWIEVYYDCELTREGITLVDTPGADSINARHTGVAFDYIKNSDAILFVTYYNHAFSKADREFLIQLGRVKDTFELDKMFFLVNAVDLANSPEEQAAVLEYVEDQLVQYGIRKPHLYPVSSLKGLNAKLNGELEGDQFFSRFEQAFYSFIANDLMTMAAEAAETKWRQAVHVIEEMIASAVEDKAAKAAKRGKLLSERDEMLQILSKKNAEVLKDRFIQEADELTYYIRQRVFIRFGEFFRESFNPALLKDDGRNLKKALESALDELLESIGFDLSQEMRATSLRMEAFVERSLREYQQGLIAELLKVNSAVSITVTDNGAIEGIDFETAFQNMDRNLFKKALAMFKNPKSFFEKNEKKLMAEELEKLLFEPAGTYLEDENSRLKEHYLPQLSSEFEAVIQDLSEQLTEYFEGITSALEDHFSIDAVKTALSKIKNYQ